MTLIIQLFADSVPTFPVAFENIVFLNLCQQLSFGCSLLLPVTIGQHCQVCTLEETMVVVNELLHM